MIVSSKGDCMVDDVLINDMEKKGIISKIKKTSYLFIKRLFDILMALIGVLFMLPIAIIVKISYLCTGDKESIFYTQRRIGKNGKVFNLYKFRSMVCNADEVLKEMLKQEKYKKQWKKYQKIDNDPRITKVGKFLRKSSLDEMPQFLNVLKGEMSMIGPRPLVEGELDEHGGNHEIYESVRCGITSNWAVAGRSDVSYDERLELEYYYVKHMGLLLDLKIIFKTISVVFLKKGVK